MDEDARMRADAAAHKAGQARALLENEALKTAFEKLEEKYLNQFRNSAFEEASAREDAWLMLRALNEFRGELSAASKGGAVAAFNMRSRLRS